MADSSWIFDVTEAEFEDKVVRRSQEVTVLVDFWAPWCGPCKALTPILEKEVTARNGDVLLAKVNTDAEQRLAMYYGIEGLPTVLAFKKGKPVDEFSGALPEKAVVQFLDRVSPSEAEKQAQVGEDLEKSDPARAEQLYREAFAKDPNQESAILGLVRILISRDLDAEAAELLERLGPGSENAAEVERLNALLGLRTLAQGLSEEPSLRQRIEANPKDARARYELGVRLALLGKHQEALEMLLTAGERDPKLAASDVKAAMVKIFHVCGARSPLSDEYRAKLTSLLY